MKLSGLVYPLPSYSTLKHLLFIDDDMNTSEDAFVKYKP